VSEGPLRIGPTDRSASVRDYQLGKGNGGEILELSASALADPTALVFAQRRGLAARPAQSSCEKTRESPQAKKAGLAACGTWHCLGIAYARWLGWSGEPAGRDDACPCSDIHATGNPRAKKLPGTRFPEGQGVRGGGECGSQRGWYWTQMTKLRSWIKQHVRGDVKLKRKEVIGRGRRDRTHGPPCAKQGALTGCATPRLAMTPLHVSS